MQTADSSTSKIMVKTNLARAVRITKKSKDMRTTETWGIPTEES